MERESPRRDQGVSWGLGDAACSAPQVQCLAHCCSGKAVKKTDKTLPSRSLNPGGRELQPSGSAPYVLEMFPLPLNHHPALPGSAFCVSGGDLLTGPVPRGRAATGVILCQRRHTGPCSNSV